MAFRTTRNTGLFADHSVNAAILQPLSQDVVLKFADERATVDGEGWLKVIFTPPGGAAIPGWVLEKHCQEVADVRPDLRVDGFVRSVFMPEQMLNLMDTTPPWFVAAEFVIARAIIETGLTNAGPKAGSDAVGPLQVSSKEWSAFLTDGAAFAKDFKPADAETDRDDPQVQIFAAMFRMFADAKAISAVKLAQQPPVGSASDPFLPSYLDIFHAYLTGSPAAAVAILDANSEPANQTRPLNVVLKPSLDDAQIAALFSARAKYTGTLASPKTVGEFVAAVEADLSDALKKAFDLMKENAPEELMQVKQGEAQWFDAALEEEKKNIDEHNPAQRDIILDYFTATDLARPSNILPWCGAFAAHCMMQSNNPVPGGAAAAKNWKNWGVGLEIGNSDIPQGAVVVLSPSEGTGSTGHVAFFVQFDPGGKTVQLLGGNQHDRLKRSSFPVSKVAAIRWIDSAPAVSAEHFQLDPSTSTSRVSKDAIKLIIASEVTSEAAYNKHFRGPTWPGLNSGVTIGIGYDVGQTNAASVQGDWGGLVATGLISAQTLNGLLKAVGIKGSAARERTRQLKGQIDVPFDAAMKVFSERDMPRWTALVEKALGPNTALLNKDCMGALVSLAYNRGTSFSKSGDRYTEMRAIKACVASKQFAGIPAQFRSMKRLWPSLRGLQIRRDEEAKLFERGLAAPPPPPPPPVGIV